VTGPSVLAVGRSPSGLTLGNTPVLTTALSSGAVASSITTFRVRLSELVTKLAVMFGNSATPLARRRRPCNLDTLGLTSYDGRVMGP